MRTNYLIYNPEAGNGRCREEAEILQLVSAMILHGISG